MRKQQIFLSAMLLAMALMISFSSCKKDDEPVVFSVSTMTAGGVNINAATPATTVPANSPSIITTFTLSVNAATATADKFSLVRDYDKFVVPLTVNVSGSTITLGISTDLGNGALYKLSVKAGLAATDGQTLAAFDRSFTTTGTFVPAGMVAYWNFENQVNDQVGSYNPITGGIIDLTYAASRNAAAGQAGSFNGTTSLVEIANGDQLMTTNDFTLAFWVKSDSTAKRAQFVMGLAGWYGFQFEINFGGTGMCKLAAQYKFGDGTSGSEDLWFPGDGNLGWQGWTFCKDIVSQGGVNFLLAKKWAYITCRYNATTKIGTMYINGEKMKEQDFKLWPTGDIKQTVTGLMYKGNAGNKAFVFGFIQDKNDPSIPDGWASYSDPLNNHFKGQLDDVRVFHKALTEQEIQLMYASEKP
jgi:hypothetical protein